MGPFDHHVFAHHEGRYQTIEASPGITNAERKTLEQFFFGQTNDDAYLSSLEAEPGLIWRTCGERLLLTRVLRGSQDASGRATLRFETIAASPASTKQVCGVLAAIVTARWKKRDGRVAIEQLREASSREIHADVVNEVVLAVRDGKRVSRASEGVSLRDVEKIVQSCAEQPGFSLCFRSLNRAVSAQVNLVASGASQTTVTIATPPTAKPTARIPAPQLQSHALRGSANRIIVPLLILVLLLQAAQFVLSRSAGPADVDPEDAAQSQIIKRIVHETGQVLSQIQAAADAIEKSQKKTGVDTAAYIAKLGVDSVERHESLHESTLRLEEAQVGISTQVADQQKRISSVDGELIKLSKNLEEFSIATGKSLVSLSRSVSTFEDKGLGLMEKRAKIEEILTSCDRVMTLIEDDFKELHNPRGRDQVQIIERIERSTKRLRTLLKRIENVLPEAETD